jgi:hypothetical protein
LVKPLVISVGRQKPPQDGQRAVTLTPEPKGDCGASYLRHQLARIEVLVGEPEAPREPIMTLGGSAAELAKPLERDFQLTFRLGTALG